MRFQSLILSVASGSVGGCTYSHNRFGQYIRRRANPVNPGSSYQQEITAAMATLQARWRDTLTQLQRDAWDAWALANPVTSSYGTFGKTGTNAYISCNVPRIQTGFPVVDTAPTVNGLAELTLISIADAPNAADQSLDIGYANTDEWAGADDGALLIYVSRPQNQTINFFKGPYRLAGFANGAVVPPTSPLTVAVPFPIATGQKLFIQARAIQADGRISSVQRLSSIVTAT